MLIQEILDIYNLIDRPKINLVAFKKLFENLPVDLKIYHIDEHGKTKPPIGGGITDFIKIIIKGKNSEKNPTLGVIGQLGGVGARPNKIGLVSDGDGALVCLSVALKLARMKKNGDELEGDIIFSTHLCPNAPVFPKKPVDFMGSPVSLTTMNKINVSKKMSAILSIDTSRGNKIINNSLFAITPPVKEGWILKIPDKILDIMEWVTDHPPVLFPITMQDITPYGNTISHVNSILQPSIVTNAPVIGIGITSSSIVPGIATGVTNLYQLDVVGRFVLEIAKEFTSNRINFYDEEEFKRLLNLYGSMKKLQKISKKFFKNQSKKS